MRTREVRTGAIYCDNWLTSAGVPVTSASQSIAGTLAVSGATTLSDTLAVTGASAFTGTLTANNAVVVTGSLTANGGISCDGGVFSVANTTGNVVTTGTLTVTGAAGFINIDAGSSGVAGSIDVFPTTALKGKFAIGVADQTGNTTVTLSVREMGQATTVSLPDPGAATSYLMQSTAQITMAEANVLDGATAGTQVAAKAVIADANVNIGATKVTALHIGATGAETEVTSTAAELNILDGVTATMAEINFAADASAQTETITAAGAVSVLLKTTSLAVVSGGAVTLAAPNSIMAGQIKTIRMTVDDGDVTMALTNVNNVAGASAGTTLTFSAVGGTAILAACGPTWTLIGVSAGAVVS